MRAGKHPAPSVGSRWRAKDQQWDRRVIEIVRVDAEQRIAHAIVVEHPPHRKPNMNPRFQFASLRSAFEQIESVIP